MFKSVNGLKDGGRLESHSKSSPGAAKKINTGLAFMYYPNGKEMDQMVCNDIACNCILLENK